MIGRVFFAPFVFFWALIFSLVLAFLFALIQIHIINYAFVMVGLPPHLAFIALLAALFGSYVNIPITRIANSGHHPEPMVRSFGVAYRVPAPVVSGSTVVAINVGGAVVPVLISLYVLYHWPTIISAAVIGTVIVTLVVHRFARPVPGLGIATPMLVPPITAALVAYGLDLMFGASQHHRDAIAFVSGVMGTLIGADLLNIDNIAGLGAPVASIGGAGTFDGIFLTGIVAVLLA
jgi:uncharacterized membrane protein